MQFISGVMLLSVFHLAVPSHDLDKSKAFYTNVFGAKVGREYPHYVIFNFFGHQFVTHLKPEQIDINPQMYPRHYGIILDNKNDFDLLYERCKKNGASFFEDLFERYKDQHGWHFSFFVYDPSNNLIELKYYVNKKDIFN